MTSNSKEYLPMAYRPLMTQWLPVLLRAIAVVIIFPQMLNKFTNPQMIGGFFQQLNIPAPDIMVYVVALIELVAVISYGLGAAGRWVAIIIIIEMVVAMLTAGPNQNNVIVLLCSIGIAILGTGALSLWKPAEPRFLRDREADTA